MLEKSQKERTAVLPTPESTPDPETNLPIPMAPSREISAGISESNIIEGPRTRKRSDRTLMAITAYFDLVYNRMPWTCFSTAHSIRPYIASFRTGLKKKKQESCLLLLLALYGLRRSPRLWQKELGSALKEIGLRQSTEDPCLSTNDFIIVLFFVGDFILLSRKEHRDKLGLDTEHDITIECDNQQTVGLLVRDEPELRTKLKHVDIHHHWLRQEVQAKRLLIE